MKNSFRFKATVMAIGSWLAAVSAQAHPGHGPDELPPAHFLTDADHLGTLLAVGVIGFCLFNARRWFNRSPKAT